MKTYNILTAYTKRMRQHLSSLCLPKTLTLYPLVVIYGLSITLKAYALPEDRTKQVHIRSHSFQYDHKQGAFIYKGDVVITQGTLIIKGDEVVLTKDTDGGINSIIVTGKPAYFKDVIQEGQAPTQAYGQKMEYHERDRILEILGKAKVTREADQFKGHEIRYLLDESKLAATGGDSHNKEDQRIEMIIQPRNYDE